MAPRSVSLFLVQRLDDKTDEAYRDLRHLNAVPSADILRFLTVTSEPIRSSVVPAGTRQTTTA